MAYPSVVGRHLYSNRPIVVTFSSSTGGRRVIWIRYFARLETAIARAASVLVLRGAPGDSMEIASNDYGFQIATLVIKAQGHLTVNFITNHEERIRHG